ncbi:MAG: recombinase family protein [Pseudomonadota bacterium]
MKKIRCAIYTRKSSEDGLDQEFNSLDAQREACEAYIVSQKHEGWVLLPDQYDDGGLSGGSLDRPALQRLLEGVRKGQIEQIVVYKIDRLTRSLADFAKIVDILDDAEASFVSVTQSFNTATSMGRLTLNMLLSFAQFEREVTAERIRDKIAASKRKGLWMGGQVPLGYDADGRTLKLNKAEAKTVRVLFDLYEQHGTLRAVKEEANRLGLRSRRRVVGGGRVSGGGPFDRGHIHHILTNPLYAGRIRHRDRVFDGQHRAIIDPERWERVQQRLQDGASTQRQKKRDGTTSPLCGKLFDETGDRLTPTHSKTKRGTRLRYYISRRLVAEAGRAHPDAWRLPAAGLELRVAEIVRACLTEPRFAATVFQDATADIISRRALALADLCSKGDGATLLGIVERIDLSPGRLTLQLSPNALAVTAQCEPGVINEGSLTRTCPFQLRKRGVETRIILAEAPAEIDETLIRNITRAHNWFEVIKSGKTFSEIAVAEGTHKSRVQQMIGLAFLAPDIIRDVLEGKQPVGFTSDWCKSNTLPSDWAEQRELLATL